MPFLAIRLNQRVQLLRVGRLGGPQRDAASSVQTPTFADIFRAGHPVWLRCSALTYSRYARSSRLASRAPRSAIWSLFSVDRPLVSVTDGSDLPRNTDATRIVVDCSHVLRTGR